jgi:hypothetical protein
MTSSGTGSALGNAGRVIGGNAGAFVNIASGSTIALVWLQMAPARINAEMIATRPKPATASSGIAGIRSAVIEGFRRGRRRWYGGDGTTGAIVRGSDSSRRSFGSGFFGSPGITSIHKIELIVSPPFLGRWWSIRRR